MGKNNNTDAHSNQNSYTCVVTGKYKNDDKNSITKSFNYKIFIITTIYTISDIDYSSYNTYCSHNINYRI